MIDFLLIPTICLTMALGLAALGLEFLGFGRPSELVFAAFCLFGVLVIVLLLVRTVTAGM